LVEVVDMSNNYKMLSGNYHSAPHPSVNALGVRPMEGRPEGNNSRGKMGEVRATGVLASGRFGGSRENKPGAQRNLAGRRDRGR
jgi:hypothetical protein